ncbi:hypothetical protein CANCADRAFT_4595 [Tortispora caseinolytica NRRL Y-17796]|uniref:Uncharacterized protein n=1 Tax=Tortispora caseinolytica NRRL Y-17796 TaxID=767744 RepID=A0A1E4T9J9_9ASCO|nr:hypothetical protein CANCADRAFT_4595 [Tortispora caseinolytica NRRL Y-17796]
MNLTSDYYFLMNMDDNHNNTENDTQNDKIDTINEQNLQYIRSVMNAGKEAKAPTDYGAFIVLVLAQSVTMIKQPYVDRLYWLNSIYKSLKSNDGLCKAVGWKLLPRLIYFSNSPDKFEKFDDEAHSRDITTRNITNAIAFITSSNCDPHLFFLSIINTLQNLQYEHRLILSTLSYLKKIECQKPFAHRLNLLFECLNRVIPRLDSAPPSSIICLTYNAFVSATLQLALDCNARMWGLMFRPLFLFLRDFPTMIEPLISYLTPDELAHTRKLLQCAAINTQEILLQQLSVQWSVRHYDSSRESSIPYLPKIVREAASVIDDALFSRSIMVDISSKYPILALSYDVDHSVLLKQIVTHAREFAYTEKQNTSASLFTSAPLLIEFVKATSSKDAAEPVKTPALPMPSLDDIDEQDETLLSSFSDVAALFTLADYITTFGSISGLQISWNDMADLWNYFLYNVHVHQLCSTVDALTTLLLYSFETTNPPKLPENKEKEKVVQLLSMLLNLFSKNYTTLRLPLRACLVNIMRLVDNNVVISQLSEILNGELTESGSSAIAALIDCLFMDEDGESFLHQFTEDQVSELQNSILAHLRAYVPQSEANFLRVWTTAFMRLGPANGDRLLAACIEFGDSVDVEPVKETMAKFSEQFKLDAALQNLQISEA